jgi:GNAT superfamily N-acetyltransferase
MDPDFIHVIRGPSAHSPPFAPKVRTVKEIEVKRDQRVPHEVESLLRSLPDWFEIEEALMGYVNDARTHDTYTAVVDGEVVGALIVKHHSRYASEVHLMAVRPTLHRCGIGRKLLSMLETDLASKSVEFLQVKTLGPSYPSVEYEKSRLFYEAMGFRALEEIEGLWPGNPCLIMVKSLG